MMTARDILTEILDGDTESANRILGDERIVIVPRPVLMGEDGIPITAAELDDAVCAVLLFDDAAPINSHVAAILNALGAMVVALAVKEGLSLKEFINRTRPEGM